MTTLALRVASKLPPAEGWITKPIQPTLFGGDVA